MIQRLGGGRVIDHGPSSAIHSRSRVPGGVMVSQAMGPAFKPAGLGSGMRGEGRPFQHGDTPKAREIRVAKARAAYAIFKAKHTGCDCHVMYGGQPRPVGYREREQDRSRLRRELRP
jgi:hypothetical protein